MNMVKLIDRPNAQTNREELPISLRQFMILCRQRTPQIMQCLDQIIEDPATESGHKIAASTLVLAYGYGKPRSSVDMTIERGNTSPVHLYLPDNGRSAHFTPAKDNLAAPTIDPEGNEQSDLDC
jgi:hypothetical protein